MGSWRARARAPWAPRHARASPTAFRPPASVHPVPPRRVCAGRGAVLSRKGCHRCRSPDARGAESCRALERRAALRAARAAPLNVAIPRPAPRRPAPPPPPLLSSPCLVACLPVQAKLVAQRTMLAQRLLREFGHGNSFSRRLLFVTVCEAMMGAFSASFFIVSARPSRTRRSWPDFPYPFPPLPYPILPLSLIHI